MSERQKRHNKSIDLSILMAAKNEALHIQDALDSLLSLVDIQPFSFEIIVIDDHSSDATANIAKKNMDQYASVVRFFPNLGQGKVAAYNLAFAHARGNYICFMGADDKAAQSGFFDRLKILKNNVECYQTASCLVQTFSDNRRFNGRIIPRPNSQSSPLLAGGSILISREIACKVFPIPEELPNEDDWVRLYLQHFQLPVAMTKTIGVLYRIHKHNSISRGGSAKKWREQRWDRSQAAVLFLARYSSILPKQQIHLIIQQYVYEKFVYSDRNLLMLFLFPGVKLRARVRMLLCCFEPLFKIKNLFRPL